MQVEAKPQPNQMPQEQRYRVATAFSLAFHLVLLILIGLWAGLPSPPRVETIPVELVFGAEVEPENSLGGEPEVEAAPPEPAPAKETAAEIKEKPAAKAEKPAPKPPAAKVLTSDSGEETVAPTRQTGEAAEEGGGEEVAAGVTQGPGIVGGPLPIYPKNAMDLGLEGQVTLLVRLNAAAQIEEAVVQKSSGHELLDEAALRAVRRGWKFEAALKDGEPAAGEVAITFVFQNNAVKRG